MSENGDMAGAAESKPPVAPVEDNAKEVFPLKFDKDYLDFRGIVEEDESGVPKSARTSSAQDTATTQPLPTGLEDVSSDDLDNPVPPNAGKEPSQSSTSASTARTS